MVYDVYTQLEIEQELEENADYLAHHGRKGQKWGHRNGPPYPLDYKDLSSEEREQAKSEAIRRGDVKEASYNREYYTDDELNKVINRFNLNAKLSDISTEKVMSTWDKIQDVSTKMQTASNAIGNASNLYNNVAKISNAFLGSNLPVIGEKKGEEGGKKDKNNNQKNKTDDKERTRIVNRYEDGKLVEYKKIKPDGRSVEEHYDDEGELTKWSETKKDIFGRIKTDSGTISPDDKSSKNNKQNKAQNSKDNSQNNEKKEDRVFRTVNEEYEDDFLKKRTFTAKSGDDTYNRTYTYNKDKMNNTSLGDAKAEEKKKKKDGNMPWGRIIY